MSRSLLLGLLTYSLLLVGLVTVQGSMLALALPLVTYLLIGYLQAPERIELQATRHLSAERVTPNSDVEIILTITNRGSSLEELLLEDNVPAGLTLRSGSSRRLVKLRKGESCTVTYTASGGRGGYVFEAIDASVNDHLAIGS
ncbi:MAG TPA: hypothetical protein VGK56_11290, partial [Anaerolineales bacterium]